MEQKWGVAGSNPGKSDQNERTRTSEFSETPLFLIKSLSQIKKARRVHRPRSRGFVPGVWGLTREHTCAVMIGCTGSCGDRRQQFPAAEGAVVPSRWGGRSRCRRAPRAWPRATPRAVPLPPHAPTRLRESSGTHSTTHQPHLDQNS